MVYQSCKHGPPPPEGMEAIMPQQIVCLDDNGTEWWVPGEDCQVGDWLRYVADGGEVAPYEPPPEPEPKEAA